MKSSLKQRPFFFLFILSGTQVLNQWFGCENWRIWQERLWTSWISTEPRPCRLQQLAWKTALVRLTVTTKSFVLAKKQTENPQHSWKMQNQQATLAWRPHLHPSAHLTFILPRLENFSLSSTTAFRMGWDILFFFLQLAEPSRSTPLTTARR